MSTNVFSHPFLSGLFDAATYDEFWSADTQITHLLNYEIAWTRALKDAGMITADGAKAALEKLENYKPDLEVLKQGVAKDGVIIPTLVMQLQEGLSDPKAIHHGSTSQDVIDTGLSLTLNALNTQMKKDLAELIGQLEVLIEKFGDKQLIARTRMQDALPISVAHKLESLSAPLLEILQEFNQIDFPLQIGGAVGDNQALGANAEKVLASVADQLGLKLPHRSWHTNRNLISKYANTLSRLSGAIGKVGQDICLMALAGGDIKLSGAGGSSAMPHKQNPVQAELLVTLARYNAGQGGIITQSMIHENERSGSAWMLEWMILPQMTEATNCSIKTAIKLLSNVKSVGHSE